MACWETCAILAINEAPEETCTARMNSQHPGKNLGKSETFKFSVMVCQTWIRAHRVYAVTRQLLDGAAVSPHEHFE